MGIYTISMKCTSLRSQVLLQVQSSDKVLTAFEAGKRNVPMLLFDVYFQGKPLGGLELAMITVDE